MSFSSRPKKLAVLVLLVLLVGAVAVLLLARACSSAEEEEAEMPSFCNFVRLGGRRDKDHAKGCLEARTMTPIPFSEAGAHTQTHSLSLSHTDT